MRALLRTEARRDTPPPLDELLLAGGDARLALDAASTLNIYGCRPAPFTDALCFSSSTASSISDRGWCRAHQVWLRLASGGSEADLLVEEAREELGALLGLGGTGAEIVFAPSGTDAALLALAVGRAMLGAPPVSILAASDETGSGMAPAVAGRHFSALTARGTRVVAGGGITGLGDGVGFIAVPLRDAAGEKRRVAAIDSDIISAVATAVASGRRALLYAMDHSKLGSRAPSAVALDEIRARFGAAVQIVIDACQARIGRERLHRHLAQGDMVLITGSKFFMGPPLSGALVIPPPIAARMAEQSRLPRGLADYSVASDWPHGWRAAAALPEQPNIGQLLRWNAALAEMRAWLAQPERRRNAVLVAFAASLRHAIAGYDELVPLADDADGACDDDEFPARTIFPFLVTSGGSALTPARAATLYRALNRDATGALPATLAPAERRIAALCCHIGQPVALGGTRGALRISAGARLISELGPLGHAHALPMIFAKIRLLLAHLDAVERAF